MTRNQALGALLLAIGLLTTGLTWQFGAYGLYAGAALVGLMTLFINIDDEKGSGGGA